MLRDTCHAVAPLLTLTLEPFEGEAVDPARLLWALAGVESTYGRDREFARLEPSYQPRGVMYVRSPGVRALWSRYGTLAACSWGSWQMMTATARDLGHTGAPWELTADQVLAPLVVRFLMRKEPETLVQVFDCYNSGSYRDRIIPEAYIRAGLAAYRAGFARGPQ